MKAQEFARIHHIHQSYFKPAATKRIFGIAYNFGQVKESDRGQIWFDKPMSSVIFDNEPL